MEEIIQNIVDKIAFKKKEPFRDLLKKCLHVSNDSSTSTYAIHDSVVFKLETLFKGFSSFQNEFGKDKKYEAGVEALSVICEELAIDIEKNECFILYHLRDLGKFRKKESDLLKELKSVWGQYKDYKLEDDRDLTYALKRLMRMKFIDYRKGNLHLKPSVIIRYRTNV